MADFAVIIDPALARAGEAARGRKQALATVVEIWSSAPHPPGSQMLIIAGDETVFHGAVSGGCIEAAVVAEAEALFARPASGEPARKGCLLRYGVSNEDAFRYGLACGGRILIWLELIRPRAGRITSAGAARIVDIRSGRNVKLGRREAIFRRYRDSGAPRLTGQPEETSPHYDGSDLLYHPAPPPWRLVIAGASMIGHYLAVQALLGGADVTMIDPRPAFIDQQRFGLAQMVSQQLGRLYQPVTAYPDEVLTPGDLDRFCGLVTLSHDPKIDDPALRIATRSPASYIGALGSKRTHAARIERLSDCDLSRVHAPVGAGLLSGSRTPAGIALAIMTEWLLKR